MKIWPREHPRQIPFSGVGKDTHHGDDIQEDKALQTCPELQQPCAIEILGLNLGYFMAHSNSGTERLLCLFLCLNY